MIPKYIEPVFRPPAEAESLIFQAAYGCPHNACRFCAMYKSVRYRERPLPELLAEIDAALAHLSGRQTRFPRRRRCYDSAV